MSTGAVLETSWLTKRLVGVATGVVLLGAAWVGVSWDAAQRRAEREERQQQTLAMVHLLGTADLALSNASRWLRHPSVTEPGAPFADGPALLDADPAGAVIGPPRELLRRSALMTADD